MMTICWTSKEIMANPRVLLYGYDDNFGEIKTLQINDVIITEDNLPECFKNSSPSICATSSSTRVSIK